MPASDLLAAADDLCRDLAPLRFAPPVSHVYNPLIYARGMHAAYLQRFAGRDVDAVFLGMNPGPFGMAQTGIPFGEVGAVRDWLKLNEPVGHPEPEHPQRLVTGLACPRSEVSGKRLWGLFSQRFKTPAAFFAKHFVANYCPLAFMDDGGANLTPDKLPASEREPLETACDRHLVRLVTALRPRWVIGIGRFASDRAREALAAAKLGEVRIGEILHPSPASPAANKDWAGQASKQLVALGIWTEIARGSTPKQ
jgi:single-strand selective monofunctional uracil DNA glycosylase